jgi:hypothetical protein
LEITWEVVAKYYVHGVVFSLLFTILAIGWLFGFLALVLVGSFLGLAIGLALLVIIVGAVNSLITGWLWFDVKGGWIVTLFHGIILMIVLLGVNGVLVLLPQLYFPGIATTIIFSFVIAPFVEGFIGKKVASIWKQELEEEQVSQAVEDEWKYKKL